MAKTRSQLGSIERRSDGVYRVSFEISPDDSGKRRRVRKTVRGTRKDAELALARLLVEHGMYGDASEMTVGEFYLTVYSQHMERLEANTKRCYRQAWSVIEPLFGIEKMESLPVQEIERRLWTIESPGTQRNAFKLLRQIYGLAYRRDYISRNPMEKDVQLRRMPDYTPETYSAEELADWSKAIRGIKYEPALLCCAFGGLRLEEAFALYWSDIERDGEYQIVHVTKALVHVDGKTIEKAPKTRKSERRVIAGGYAAARLGELRKRGKYVPLVDNGKGQRSSPASCSKNYKLWCMRHGVKYIPIKNLRTTYATLLKEAGQTDGMISSSLGHSTIQTAHKRYAMTTDKALERNADILAKAVGCMGSKVVPRCSLLDFSAIKKASEHSR